jgi:hypothetical protein
MLTATVVLKGLSQSDSHSKYSPILTNLRGIPVLELNDWACPSISQTVEFLSNDLPLPQFFTLPYNLGN